ncbi:TBC1 domain family member 23, related [Neospora caninum Liverpool]|uniref:TBC1 domain family member 23, related n=1 Tax=Neospora caninum (strain Liverpool) TaxID=572307 RepID=F0VPB1_NEOCL|nr:TBC1 domain family member 23, related [Neospora caninum Liverpool]CBZ55557.1 TBC1 domain family member 23, related [Neospora caninum Liverpool]CEL70297.1 TPA: TBC1 domain family member 23, related [Neospora caninum Liverpool]|eukprot:XP_003885585.1 TBC1 domain family member 23, related [Neospora caninum Liverpool]
MPASSVPSSDQDVPSLSPPSPAAASLDAVLAADPAARALASGQRRCEAPQGAPEGTGETGRRDEAFDGGRGGRGRGEEGRIGDEREGVSQRAGEDSAVESRGVSSVRTRRSDPTQTGADAQRTCHESAREDTDEAEERMPAFASAQREEPTEQPGRPGGDDASAQASKETVTDLREAHGREKEMESETDTRGLKQRESSCTLSRLPTSSTGIPAHDWTSSLASLSSSGRSAASPASCGSIDFAYGLHLEEGDSEMLTLAGVSQSKGYMPSRAHPVPRPLSTKKTRGVAEAGADRGRDEVARTEQEGPKSAESHESPVALSAPQRASCGLGAAVASDEGNEEGSEDAVAGGKMETDPAREGFRLSSALLKPSCEGDAGTTEQEDGAMNTGEKKGRGSPVQGASGRDHKGFRGLLPDKSGPGAERREETGDSKASFPACEGTDGNETSDGCSPGDSSALPSELTPASPAPASPAPASSGPQPVALLSSTLTGPSSKSPRVVCSPGQASLSASLLPASCPPACPPPACPSPSPASTRSACLSFVSAAAAAPQEAEATGRLSETPISRTARCGDSSPSVSAHEAAQNASPLSSACPLPASSPSRLRGCSREPSPPRLPPGSLRGMGPTSWSLRHPRRADTPDLTASDSPVGSRSASRNADAAAAWIRGNTGARASAFCLPESSSFEERETEECSLSGEDGRHRDEKAETTPVSSASSPGIRGAEEETNAEDLGEEETRRGDDSEGEKESEEETAHAHVEGKDALNAKERGNQSREETPSKGELDGGYSREGSSFPRSGSTEPCAGTGEGSDRQPGEAQSTDASSGLPGNPGSGVPPARAVLSRGPSSPSSAREPGPTWRRRPAQPLLVSLEKAASMDGTASARTEAAERLRLGLPGVGRRRVSSPSPSSREPVSLRQQALEAELVHLLRAVRACDGREAERVEKARAPESASLSREQEQEEERDQEEEREQGEEPGGEEGVRDRNARREARENGKECGQSKGQNGESEDSAHGTDLRRDRAALMDRIRCIVSEMEVGLPMDLRGATWQVLLGVEEDPDRDARLAESIKETTLDEPNQRVIRSDVERTRASLAFYRDAGSRAWMEKLLTSYCKTCHIKYKQGLNELLAPFLYLKDREGFSVASVFNCFRAFVRRFLPAMFCDDEFTSLQCAFHLFKHLLAYHDPALADFLESHFVTPELYVTPWFLTLFSSKTSLLVLFALWDKYVAEGDPDFFPFLALALLICCRTDIQRTEVSQLPETLSKIAIHSVEQLREVWALAKELKAQTPLSFSVRMFASQHGSLVRCLQPLQQLEMESAFFTFPEEVLNHAYGLTGRPSAEPGRLVSLPSPPATASARNAPLALFPPDASEEPSSAAAGAVAARKLVAPLVQMAPQWKMLLLDLRPAWCFEAGRLPPAIHIDLLGDWRATLSALLGVFDPSSQHVASSRASSSPSSLHLRAGLRHLAGGFRSTGARRSSKLKPSSSTHASSPAAAASSESHRVQAAHREEREASPQPSPASGAGEASAGSRREGAREESVQGSRGGDTGGCGDTARRESSASSSLLEREDVHSLVHSHVEKKGSQQSLSAPFSPSSACGSAEKARCPREGDGEQDGGEQNGDEKGGEEDAEVLALIPRARHTSSSKLEKGGAASRLFLRSFRRRSHQSVTSQAARSSEASAVLLGRGSAAKEVKRASDRPGEGDSTGEMRSDGSAVAALAAPPSSLQRETSGRREGTRRDSEAGEPGTPAKCPGKAAPLSVLWEEAASNALESDDDSLGVFSDDPSLYFKGHIHPRRQLCLLSNSREAACLLSTSLRKPDPSLVFSKAAFQEPAREDCMQAADDRGSRPLHAPCSAVSNAFSAGEQTRCGAGGEAGAPVEPRRNTRGWTFRKGTAPDGEKQRAANAGGSAETTPESAKDGVSTGLPVPSSRDASPMRRPSPGSQRRGNQETGEEERKGPQGKGGRVRVDAKEESRRRGPEEGADVEGHPCDVGDHEAHRPAVVSLSSARPISLRSLVASEDASEHLEVARTLKTCGASPGAGPRGRVDGVRIPRRRRVASRLPRLPRLPPRAEDWRERESPVVGHAGASPPFDQVLPRPCLSDGESPLSGGKTAGGGWVSACPLSIAPFPSLSPSTQGRGQAALRGGRYKRDSEARHTPALCVPVGSAPESACVDDSPQTGNALSLRQRSSSGREGEDAPTSRVREAVKAFHFGPRAAGGDAEERENSAGKDEKENEEPLSVLPSALAPMQSGDRCHSPTGVPLSSFWGGTGAGTAKLFYSRALTLEENAESFREEKVQMPTHHACLITSEETSYEEALEVYRVLTQEMGVRWVSIAKGGYRACHDVAVREGLELVDHNPAACPLCTESPSAGETSHRSRRGSLLSRPSSPALGPSGPVPASARMLKTTPTPPHSSGGLADRSQSMLANQVRPSEKASGAKRTGSSFSSFLPLKSLSTSPRSASPSPHHVPDAAWFPSLGGRDSAGLAFGGWGPAGLHSSPLSVGFLSDLPVGLSPGSVSVRGAGLMSGDDEPGKGGASRGGPFAGASPFSSDGVSPSGEDSAISPFGDQATDSHAPREFPALPERRAGAGACGRDRESRHLSVPTSSSQGGGIPFSGIIGAWRRFSATARSPRIGSLGSAGAGGEARGSGSRGGRTGGPPVTRETRSQQRGSEGKADVDLQSVGLHGAFPQRRRDSPGEPGEALGFVCPYHTEGTPVSAFAPGQGVSLGYSSHSFAPPGAAMLAPVSADSPAPGYPLSLVPLGDVCLLFPPFCPHCHGALSGPGSSRAASTSSRSGSSPGERGTGLPCAAACAPCGGYAVPPSAGAWRCCASCGAAVSPCCVEPAPSPPAGVGASRPAKEGRTSGPLRGERQEGGARAEKKEGPGDAPPVHTGDRNEGGARPVGPAAAPVRSGTLAHIPTLPVSLYLLNWRDLVTSQYTEQLRCFHCFIEGVFQPSVELVLESRRRALQRRVGDELAGQLGEKREEAESAGSPLCEGNEQGDGDGSSYRQGSASVDGEERYTFCSIAPRENASPKERKTRSLSGSPADVTSPSNRRGGSFAAGISGEAPGSPASPKKGRRSFLGVFHAASPEATSASPASGGKRSQSSASVASLPSRGLSGGDAAASGVPLQSLASSVAGQFVAAGLGEGYTYLREWQMNRPTPESCRIMITPARLLLVSAPEPMLVRRRRVVGCDRTFRGEPAQKAERKPAARREAKAEAASEAEGAPSEEEGTEGGEREGGEQETGRAEETPAFLGLLGGGNRVIEGRDVEEFCGLVPSPPPGQSPAPRGEGDRAGEGETERRLETSVGGQAALNPVAETRERRKSEGEQDETHLEEVVQVYASFELSEILKITSKKNNSKLLCFYFNANKTQPLMVLRFESSPAAHDCIGHVRGLYRLLKTHRSHQTSQPASASSR